MWDRFSGTPQEASLRDGPRVHAPRWGCVANQPSQFRTVGCPDVPDRNAVHRNDLKLVHGPRRRGRAARHQHCINASTGGYRQAHGGATWQCRPQGGARQLVFRPRRKRSMRIDNAESGRRDRIPLSSERRPGTRLGRMSESSAAIGLASARAGCPPPKKSACVAINISYRRRGRRRQARVSKASCAFEACENRRRAASPRSKASRGPVDAENAHITRRIGLSSASARHDGGSTFTISPAPATRKAERPEHALDFGRVFRDHASLCTPARGNVDDAAV